jgi:hypothetical protein
MNTKVFSLLALSVGLSGLCSAQTPTPSASLSSSTSSTTTSTTAKTSAGAPYTEGAVWTLTMIKTKTGFDDDYFRQITGTVKPIYDEEKKQKMILDYKILMGDPHGRDEANIIIMVQYANMAALDGLRDKMDPLIEKVMGNEDQRRATAVKRLDIREILGVRTMREITLK